jgi:hypothetical protein
MDHIEFARMGAEARNKKMKPAERSAASRHAVTMRWEQVRAKKAAAALKLANRKAKPKTKGKTKP